MEGVLVGTSEGAPSGSEAPTPDLMINALFIVTLKNLKKMDEKFGKAFAYYNSSSDDWCI